MECGITVKTDEAVKELREKENQIIEVMIWKELDDAGWNAVKIRRLIKKHGGWSFRKIITIMIESTYPKITAERDVDNNFVIKMDMNGIKITARRPNWLEKILYGKRG